MSDYVLGAIIGSLLAGIFVGMIPAICGAIKKKLGLAIGGFFCCVVSSLILGLLLAVPCCAVFLFFIFKGSSTNKSYNGGISKPIPLSSSELSNLHLPNITARVMQVSFLCENVLREESISYERTTEYCNDGLLNGASCFDCGSYKIFAGISVGYELRNYNSLPEFIMNDYGFSAKMIYKRTDNRDCIAYTSSTPSYIIDKMVSACM